MLGPAQNRAHAWVGQVRAGFAEKTVLRARLLSYSSSAAIFPRKPRLVSELNAWVRAGPRRVCRENPAPRCVVVLYRVCYFLNPLHAPSRFRSTGAPTTACKAHVHAAHGFGHLY